MEFISGLIIGAVAGFFTAALFAAGKDDSK